MTFSPRVRCRWQTSPGRWEVQSRIERFVEPAVLLLLSERPHHGYELAQEMTALLGDESGADIGNLYRVLRGLELEGIVTSVWKPQFTGPPRRTYALTRAGESLLAMWVGALRRTESALAAFLRRYETSSGPAARWAGPEGSAGQGPAGG